MQSFKSYLKKKWSHVGATTVVRNVGITWHNRKSHKSFIALFTFFPKELYKLLILHQDRMSCNGTVNIIWNKKSIMQDKAV